MNFDDTYSDIINDLFIKAKEKDEFEFCCTLLRIRGNESAGWDSLEESYSLITNILSIISAPIDNLFRVRLLLLLYCHITEMNDFYNIVANLLWILLGERYHIDPFYYKLYEDRRTIYSPESKVDRIIELSVKVGLSEIGDLYKYMLVKEVRNAFFHSDYALYENEFRIINGKGVTINNITSNAIPFEWLLKRIELTINVVLYLLYKIDEYRKSYREEKVIKGRIFGEEYGDVRLTIDEHGLRGFRC